MNPRVPEWMSVWGTIIFRCVHHHIAVLGVYCNGVLGTLKVIGGIVELNSSVIIYAVGLELYGRPLQICVLGSLVSTDSMV